MNKALYKNLVWTSILLVAATAQAADPDFTSGSRITNPANTSNNRLSLSGRYGFNISGKFKGIGDGLFIAPPVNPRRTPPQTGRPNGDAYNYEDGYVLTDISGNLGGETTYWGYDSGSQISGNTILLSRSLGGTAVSGNEKNADPTLSGELIYNHQLGASGRKRYGFEVALNYQSVSFSDHSSYAADLTRATDAFPFEAGTTPPLAPYQGSFIGSGFLLGDTPVGPSTITVVPGGMIISGSRRFDADLVGFRVGPYLEFSVSERMNVSLSAGFSLGWLVADASWSETGALPGGASVSTSSDESFSDFDTLLGGFARADVTYALGKNWSVLGGLQFQSFGNYKHNFAGHKVELDLGGSIYVTLGLGKSF